MFTNRGDTCPIPNRYHTRGERANSGHSQSQDTSEGRTVLNSERTVNASQIFGNICNSCATPLQKRHGTQLPPKSLVSVVTTVPPPALHSHVLCSTHTATLGLSHERRLAAGRGAATAAADETATDRRQHRHLSSVGSHGWSFGASVSLACLPI